MLIDLLDYSITILLLSYLFYHLILQQNSFNKGIDDKAKFVENFTLIFKLLMLLDFAWSFFAFWIFTRKRLFSQEYMLTRNTLLFKLIGLLLFIAGMSFRLWSISTLGKFFTYRVAILNEHKLIKEGPYRYLIHPSYTGIVMTLLGQYIYTQNSIYFTGVSIAIEGLLLALRINIEEKTLKEKFKGEWEEYFKNRNRLIPYLF